MTPEEQAVHDSNERRTTLVKYGDKLVPLGDRLDVLEKRLNVITLVLAVLAADHIATVPGLVQALAKLLGGI